MKAFENMYFSQAQLWKNSDIWINKKMAFNKIKLMKLHKSKFLKIVQSGHAHCLNLIYNPIRV